MILKSIVVVNNGKKSHKIHEVAKSGEGGGSETSFPINTGLRKEAGVVVSSMLIIIIANLDRKWSGSNLTGGYTTV